MRKLFKKINVRKGILILFAFSAAMPFLSIIGANLTTKLSDVLKVDAADVIDKLENLPDPSGFVTAPNDKMYYDGPNKIIYSNPYSTGKNTYKVDAVINLNKKSPKSIEAFYHLENYTAIKEIDFIVPKVQKVVIPAFALSVTVSIDVNASNFGVGFKNSNFYVTRAFRFVLDSLKDADNKEYQIYDGTTNGYKLVNGKLCRDDVLCRCPNKYTYNTMDQYENVTSKGTLQTFTDYYEYLSQVYGEGPGSVENNTYDMGGTTQREKSLIGYNYHKMDNEDGRYYRYDGAAAFSQGGLRAVPQQTNSYYDKNLKKSVGPYRDWLNRIVLTNLGHSYGSYNFFLNKGHDKPSANHIQSFFLGDYSFVSSDKTDFGYWTLMNSSGNETKIKKDHYSWCMNFRLNNRDKTHWYITEQDLETFRNYMIRVVNGDDKIPADEELLSGYAWSDKITLNKKDEVKKITVIDYKKVVTASFLNKKDEKICWFPLVGNDTPETFGFNLYHQHLDSWFWRTHVAAKGQTFFTVLDDVEPTIQNNTSVEIGNVAKNNKIRMTVRFNEPVQSFEHSYFTADAGSGISLKFTPVPGQMEGCDTVVYETDIKNLNDVYISKITVTSDILYDQIPATGQKERYVIHDYAQGGGHTLPARDSDNHLRGKTFDVAINKKKPVISKAPGDIPKVPTQGATTQIIVSYLAEGKIYYSYVKDNGGFVPQPIFSDEEISTENIYSNCIKVEKLQNNSQVTLDMPASKLRTGNFYCFVKGVTNMGVEKMFPVDIVNTTKIDTGIGPYLIDNIAPTIQILKDPYTFTATERTFNVVVHENCGIDKVTVKLNKTYGQKSDQINTFDVSLEKSATEEGLYTGSFTLTLKNIIERYYTIKETGKSVFNPELEYEDFSLSFSAIDKAGNKQDAFEWEGENRKTPIVLPFSSHPYIPVKITNISNEPVISEIDNLNLYPVGTSFTFQADVSGTVGLLQASVLKLPRNGELREFYGTYNSDLTGINISQGNPTEENKSIVTLNKPGYYEIVIRNTEECYSDAFKFYITNNLTERTPNYINAMESTTLVPKNNAWQLNPESRLYYLDETAAYHSVAYEGISDPLFSSQSAAKNYIKGHEYQDLYLIHLTMDLANMLNESGGVSGYQRASGESTIAHEGQYWVRYKNANWSIASQTSTSWAYYFYCNSTPSEVSIDLETISQRKVLKNQIEHVSDMLAANGSTIYLVDDDHTDPKTGAPRLTTGQLAATKEFTIERTLSNSPVNSIVIKGDSEMYANYVTVFNGVSFETYRLASNLPIVKNESIDLYVKLAVGEQKYRKLTCQDGTPLKEALNTEDSIAGSGIYRILEISPEGANVFDVYVDKDNPHLEIQRSVYNPVEGKTVSTTTTIDGSIIIDFYSKEFQINGYPKKDTVIEVDEFAYVAVFQKTKLVKFAYISQLDGNPMILPDGIYDVVVGDRSGNRYTFRAYVSGSDIDVQFKVNSDNSKLTIGITNREESELIKFEIYYNDELIDSALTNPKVYTQSGKYYAVVQDQYGNQIKTETFTFTKVMPEIKFYYMENGMPYPYKENDENPHIIINKGDDSTIVRTCSPIRITYIPETTEILILGCPEEYYVVDTSTGTITFNTPCDFIFYVYYKDHPEENVRYDVGYDNKEPILNGKYDVPVYELEDLKPGNFDTNTNTPNTLDYFPSKALDGSGIVTKSCNVEYGSTISADFISFEVTDDTKVKSITVTRDGVNVPVDLVEKGQKGFEFILEGIAGHYLIIATDIFNKSTSLEFNVDNSNFSAATIDGNAVQPVGPLTIDGHKVLYGNSNATIVCDPGSIINIRYHDNNVTYAIRFAMEGEEICYSTYEIGYDTDGTPIVTDKSGRIQVAAFPFKPFVGIDLEISVDLNGHITIKYNAGANKSNLDIRVNRRDEEYNLYNMEFCKEICVPEFYDGEYKLEPQNHYVYGSKEARIIDPTGDLVKIYIAYNPTSESFDDDMYIEYTDDYEFGNGFYSYIIVNKYGITDKYTVVISDKFEVTITLTFFDKDPESYSIDYGNSYSSNKTITVVGYNIVSLNEEHGYGDVLVEDGKTTITFTQPGNYKLVIIDKYNNRATLMLTINTTGITYREEWLTGYNENALLKDQGYTNQMLSVNLTEEQANALGITQIFYFYEGKKTTLYGYIGGDINIPFDPETLKNVIGSDGDGIYYVYFSNKFGDVCLKTIHYQVQPTLSITRTTNADDVPEAVDINDAIQNGVWSNLRINLSTSLNEGQYEFYVKNESTSKYERQNINYLFELVNAASSGEIHYTVKYIDAYGNIHEFTINLLRRELTFNKNNIKLINLDNANYTKENFYFDFDSNDVSIMCSFNGGDFVDYKSKEIIFKDGLYAFYMYDKAGNQTSFVVIKDSIVLFDVMVNGEIKNIYSGAALNGERVAISSTADEGVTLVSAKFNGEKLNDTSLVYTKSGVYELILKDRVGNIRYFTFTLVSNELNSFEYTTTNDHFVAVASFTNAAGIKVSCMDKITENGSHIDLLNAEEGVYEFQIKNRYDNSIIVLVVVIDKQSPTAQLDGCKDGDVTTQDINLTKLVSGDVVKVYRDGKQVQEVEIGTTTSIETITEGGKYRIVVTNKAGTSVEFNFEKLTIANGALSALVIVGLLAVSGSFFAVLLLRNRSKNDD